MIIGQVTADREAVISVDIRGAEEQKEDFEAVLDTGFTEYLTLSAEVIARLGLEQVHTAQVILGDGSEVQIPVYRAEVLWHDQWRLIYVHATEGGALVGMSLLYGSVLRIHVIDGGEVTIEPLVNQ